MNTPTETHEVEVIKRFLFRFADLMSNGSNSANLLLAAQLLEANVNRADDAEERLRQERLNRANLEAQLADDHVQVPISILRLASSQFESLARAFEKSGNVISQAMCEASAAILRQVLEARTTPTNALAFPPAAAEKGEIAHASN